MSDREELELIAGEVAGGDDTPRGRYSEVEATNQKCEDVEEDAMVKNCGDDSVLNDNSAPTAHAKDCVEITVDEAMEKIGFGPFQVLVTFFTGMLWLADAMELMLLSVLSPAVECQWGLTRAEEATITSVVFVGFLIGGLLWGVVTDIIGRKKGLLMICIVILVCGVLSAVKVAPDDLNGKAFGYPWLLICRFGVGVGAGGTPQAVTYYAEFLPLKKRGCCLVFQEIWWTIGSMFGALLALGVMDTLGWHWYLGLATIPLFLVLLLFPFVPESARFYVMKGKPKKAKAVLEIIAWYNRKPCPQGELVSVERKEAKATDLESTLTVSYSQETGVSFMEGSSLKTEEEAPLLNQDENHDENDVNKGMPQSKVALFCQSLKEQLFTSLQMFTGGVWKTTILLWIIWIGCGWIYYGVVLLTTSVYQYDNHCFSDSSDGIQNETQNVSNGTTECKGLGADYYLKIFWVTLAELPGVLVTLFVIEVFGRKRTMSFEFVMAMIGFLLLFICTSAGVTTLFLFVIRAFATGVFQAVYVYTPEVYATNIRASALGVHSAAARIGALLTPFNAQVLFHSNDFAAVSLYAASCLIVAIAALLLPIETKGKSLMDGTLH